MKLKEIMNLKNDEQWDRNLVWTIFKDINKENIVKLNYEKIECDDILKLKVSKDFNNIIDIIKNDDEYEFDLMEVVDEEIGEYVEWGEGVWFIYKGKNYYKIIWTEEKILL